MGTLMGALQGGIIYDRSFFRGGFAALKGSKGLAPVRPAPDFYCALSEMVTAPSNWGGDQGSWKCHKAD